MVSVIAEYCKLKLYQLMPYKYGAEDAIIIWIDDEKLNFKKIYIKCCLVNQRFYNDQIRWVVCLNLQMSLNIFSIG